MVAGSCLQQWNDYLGYAPGATRERNLLPECGDYLSGIGESSRFELGEYRLAVNDNIEDATTPSDQRRLRSKALAPFVRQTGGAWLVVSRRAILDGDLHDVPPAIAFRREMQLGPTLEPTWAIVNPRESVTVPRSNGGCLVGPSFAPILIWNVKNLGFDCLLSRQNTSLALWVEQFPC